MMVIRGSERKSTPTLGITLHRERKKEKERKKERKKERERERARERKLAYRSCTRGHVE